MKAATNNERGRGACSVLFSKKGVRMATFIFVFLLLLVSSGGLGFLAGYLAGRATERYNVETMIDKYYGKGQEWTK